MTTLERIEAMEIVVAETKADAKSVVRRCEKQERELAAMRAMFSKGSRSGGDAVPPDRASRSTAPSTPVKSSEA